MEYVGTEEFLRLSHYPMVDVRSPREFEEGHIPMAINIPLLEDQEREIVGTLFKQEGAEAAINKGYELVNPRRSDLLDRGLQSSANKGLRIYCWRGGLRSQKMAELFESGGITCRVLEGGYKAYRGQLRENFQSDYTLIVLMGMTGSGKTDLLRKLAQMGEQVLDLEGLARHRGSAFGAIGMGEQPTTAQFQNELNRAFEKFDLTRSIWVECESYNIGQVYLPDGLWEKMLLAPAIEIQVDQKLRIQRLVEEYGKFSIEDLEQATLRIEKRLGTQNTQKVREYLEQKELKLAAGLLLFYYDKSYHNSLKRFKPAEKISVELDSLEDGSNAKRLQEISLRLTNRK